MTTRKYAADCVFCGQPAKEDDDVCLECYENVKASRVEAAVSAWNVQDTREIELLGA